MEIQGLEDLQERLRDPEMLGAAMRVFGSRAARAGKNAAVGAIEGGQGIATRSIFAKASPLDGEVRVYSVMPMASAQLIEEGRAPGNPPSMRALLVWMRAVHHGGKPREVMAGIVARGARGKRYMGQALEEWEANLSRWMQEAATRIEKRWAKREAGE